MVCPKGSMPSAYLSNVSNYADSRATPQPLEWSPERENQIGRFSHGRPDPSWYVGGSGSPETRTADCLAAPSANLAREVTRRRRSGLGQSKL